MEALVLILSMAALFCGGYVLMGKVGAYLACHISCNTIAEQELKRNERQPKGRKRR